jgi:hypothetical protein
MVYAHSDALHLQESVHALDRYIEDPFDRPTLRERVGMDDHFTQDGILTQAERVA